MQIFKDGGFVPEWAQLGNETNPGMLLPDGSIDDFGRLTRLFNAAHDGVKAVSPGTKTIIHLAEGDKTALCQNYFDNLARNGCRYDMIGLSYYPWWLNKPNAEVIGGLEATLRELPARFDKDIMIVETGGRAAEEDESFDLLQSVIELCNRTKRCKGLFYWEPEGAEVWSQYSLCAWRADGTPTRAMDAYRSIKHV
jgi:arabinogalactan endo-1,4-beta-galactosidase